MAKACFQRKSRYALGMSSAVETAPAPPAKKKVYTYDELAATMPETNLPHELWDGELSMAPAPSFSHQEISLRFYRALYDFVSSRNLGTAVTAPIDMVLSQHRVVQPDVLFVAVERLRIIGHAVMEAADLVAEVVSLGGRNRDRIEKRDLYEQHGVKEYWIIDPEPETIDVLHLVNGRYELVIRADGNGVAGSRLLPGFEVAARELFGVKR